MKIVLLSLMITSLLLQATEETQDKPVTMIAQVEQIPPPTSDKVSETVPVIPNITDDMYMVLWGE